LPDRPIDSTITAANRIPCWAWFAVLALVLLKLILISHDEIVAYTDDDYGYAYSASVWYWGVPYQKFPYSRQPLYNLFLALSTVFAIPARLWIEFLWMSAATVMLTALRRVGLSIFAALAAFALVLFHPWTLMLFNRFLSDSLYGALMLIFLSSLIAGVMQTTRGAILRWGLLAAASGALAANTRVESSLILGSLAATACCILGLKLWAGADRSVSLHRFACIILLPIAAIFALTHTIKAINRHHIGSYVTTDFELPGFLRLNRALLSIKPANPDVRLAVPHDAREWAYAHSPTFARLKPFLESDPDVLAYAIHTERATGVKSEYGAWTVWGLRVAAWQLQPWSSARELDEFYKQCAGEIFAALHKEPAAKRWGPDAFIPPEWGQLIRNLPESLGHCRTMFLYAEYRHLADLEMDKPGLERFNAVGGRRAMLVKLNSGQSVEGSFWHSPENIARLDRWKTRLAKAHKPITYAELALVGAGTLVGIFGIRRRIFPAHWYVLTTILLSAILARFALVALLDVTGIPVLARYLFAAVAPLAMLALLNFCSLLSLLLRPGKAPAKAK
jgi:hypothetical protein